MELSEIGQVARKFWLEIAGHFKNVQLDQFVIMPNHLHGIIIVGVQYIEPLRKQPQQNSYQRLIPKSIGSIIRSYKAAVSRWCRNNGFKDFQWQRNYYERVIRNQT